MAGYDYFRPAAGLAGAAAGHGSPFGFGRGLPGLFGAPGAGYGFGVGRPVITPPPHSGGYGQPRPPAAAAFRGAASLTPGGPQNTAPTAKGVDTYDINTDPAYQQAQALIGLSDQQATAAAQKQVKDLLLAYGDPGLVSKVLGGGGGDLAKAAGANPTSTLAQLHQQKDRNQKQLGDQLNSANLSYSGYRVDQEKQAAQDYQNALAQAAANVQSQIGTIQSNLQQALFNNQWTLAQAAQAAAANGAGSGVSQGSTSGASPTGSSLADWMGWLFGGGAGA